MKFTIFLATSAMLALSACGGEDRSQTSEQTNVATENMALDNMSMTNDSANMMGGAETAANGQEYAAMASASDMFEIESSRLAAEKSQNAGVKELAQMLITDHEKSTADLKKA